MLHFGCHLYQNYFVKVLPSFWPTWPKRRKNFYKVVLILFIAACIESYKPSKDISEDDKQA